MTRYLILLISSLVFFQVNGQDEVTYLKANAIRIDNPEKLGDNVYTLLSPFQVIMFGEMHGTNESTPFVNGLVNLFNSKGDSILVGFEIPPVLMSKFLSIQTDSSVYQSEFFSNPPYMDGKESVPWANLISTLNKNQKVKIFFFDVSPDEGQTFGRDSLMAAKIKAQFIQHPTWRIITLSGNYHNRITNTGSMTSILKRNISSKVCSLNMEYKEGTAFANFTHGMEIKQLGSYPSAYNSTEGYDRYILLLSTKSNYDYDGMYYTKTITAATMTTSK